MARRNSSSLAASDVSEVLTLASVSARLRPEFVAKLTRLALEYEVLQMSEPPPLPARAVDPSAGQATSASTTRLRLVRPV